MTLNLQPKDRILFLGDSITEQHLWTLFVENLLLWHEPTLVIRNRGWAANRAVDGLARFDRDVLPFAPTWLFIAFGMNDGGYQPPSAFIQREYREALARLVDRGRMIGTEPILCSPSAVDEACDPTLAGYNQVLADLTEICADVAGRTGTRFVDLYHPMLAAGPGLIPDGIHPNPQGHLILARAAASQLSLTQRATLQDDGTPDPTLPWQETVHPGPERYSIYLDGERAGNFSGSQLAQGVNLSGGGLRARARAVMELSRAIWQMDRSAWRSYGPLGLDGSRSASAAEAALAAVSHLEAVRRQLLQQPVQVESRREEPIPLGPWAISGPYYPNSPAHLLTQQCGPEAGQPGSEPPLPWQPVEPVGPDGYVNLLPLFGPVTHAVAYAQCHFVAPKDGELLLRLGSDDGYRLYLNGHLAGDLPLFRGSAPGQELHRLPVRKGTNQLLLRLHQGIGGWDFYATAFLRPNQCER